MPTKYMSDSEICMFYKQARDQYEEITILSELNACDERTIIEILHSCGVYDYNNPPKPLPKDDVEPGHGMLRMGEKRYRRDQQVAHKSIMPQGERRKTKYRRNAEEQERDYRPLYEQGMTDGEIARELNMISSGGVARWRNKNNLPPNTPPGGHHWKGKKKYRKV